MTTQPISLEHGAGPSGADGTDDSGLSPQYELPDSPWEILASGFQRIAIDLTIWDARNRAAHMGSERRIWGQVISRTLRLDSDERRIWGQAAHMGSGHLSHPAP